MKATARDRRLLTLYGITGAEYDRILEYQGGACYVCLRPPKTVRLSVDHRHSDGLTRGLLCHECNKALAYLRDNADRAARLCDYLIYHPTVSALGGCRYGRPGRSTRKWKTKREKRDRMAWVAGRLSELDRVGEGGTA